MIDVDTSAAIATVQDKEAFRNWPSCFFVSAPVRQNLFSFDVQRAIARAGFAFRPNDARAHAG